MHDLVAGLLILGTFSGILPGIILVGFIYLIIYIVKACRGEIGLTKEEIRAKRKPKVSKEDLEIQEKIRKLREKIYS